MSSNCLSRYVNISIRSVLCLSVRFLSFWFRIQLHCLQFTWSSNRSDWPICLAIQSLILLAQRRRRKRMNFVFFVPHDWSLHQFWSGHVCDVQHVILDYNANGNVQTLHDSSGFDKQVCARVRLSTMYSQRSPIRHFSLGRNKFEFHFDWTRIPTARQLLKNDQILRLSLGKPIELFEKLKTLRKKNDFSNDAESDPLIIEMIIWIQQPFEVSSLSTFSTIICPWSFIGVNSQSANVNATFAIKIVIGRTCKFFSNRNCAYK